MKQKFREWVRPIRETEGAWIVIAHELVVRFGLILVFGITLDRLFDRTPIPNMLGFFLAFWIANKIEKRIDARLKEADEIVKLRIAMGEYDD